MAPKLSRGEAARQRDLEAGQRILNEKRDIVGKLVTEQEICKATGLTTRNFRDLWERGPDTGGGEPKENFDRALVKFACTPENFDSMSGELRKRIAALAYSEDLVADLREVMRYDFNVVRDDRAFAMQLVLLSLRSNRTVADSLCLLYQDFDKDLEAHLTDLLAAWQRDPLEGLSIRDLAVVFNCVVEGFALRARIESNERGSRAELYEAVGLCILKFLTMPKGQDITLDEVVADINDWPRHQRPQP